MIALLCFADATSEDETILSILPFFLFTSSVFLIATFVIYLILPRLRNVHGLTVMCYAASLAAMYIGHGVNQLSRGLTTTSCILLGISLTKSNTVFHSLNECFKASLNHLTFLSSFTWLNVMSLDIWLTLKYSFVCYSLVLLTSIRMQSQEHGTEEIRLRPGSCR